MERKRYQCKNVVASSPTLRNLSRHELLKWINETLGLKLVRVEQLCSGAQYCQLLDMLFPGCIPLHKIKSGATQQHEYKFNLQHLQLGFRNVACNKKVPITSMVKGKFQENFDFLQWFKRFFDANFNPELSAPVREVKKQLGTTPKKRTPQTLACPVDSLSAIMSKLSVAEKEMNIEQKDYIFDVKVDDDVGSTIYKLAFNKGENPWDVATKFAAEHDVPTDIGRIVDFILKNTVATFSNEFFPAKNYLTYLKVNTEGLRGKLLEFCQKVPKEKSLTLKEVDELMLLACNPDIVSIDQMCSLSKAISWNDEYLYPVLDLLRIGVKCKGLRLKVSSRYFLNHMLHILMHTKKNVNIVLVEKIICNMFGMDETQMVLVCHQEKIFEAVKEIFTSGEKSIQKAGAALFLNFAIFSYNGIDIAIGRYCFNVVDILPYLIDADAIYRMLVAVGTVCTRYSWAVSYFKSVNVKEFILKFKDCSDNPKINKVIELLCADF